MCSYFTETQPMFASRDRILGKVLVLYIAVQDNSTTYDSLALPRVAPEDSWYVQLSLQTKTTAKNFRHKMKS